MVASAAGLATRERVDATDSTVGRQWLVVFGDI